MNLDELRTVQSKERSKDSLQHLRESFYSDVGRYIAELKDQRERAADQAADPFDDPEVNRLTDEINTAEEVVEAVYERRVGKVVKRASLAAAGMPADEEGLTSEEQRLFNELVERIEENKAEVLDVLGGDVVSTTNESADASTDAPAPAETTPAGTEANSTPEGTSPTDAEVSAADVMGGGGDSSADSASATDDAPAADATSTTESPDTESDDADRPSAEAAAIVGNGDGASDDEVADQQTPDESESSSGLDDRTTVRITSDVGEIFGVDERTYELADEDVVTLPAENAVPLVEQGAAEELQ
ncbi:hypothetical protein [Halorussus halophilus]|uniref:hypothetical protein n=1 Tax=Halorussus halophilus TaxID=2650975 RepID=UPI001300CF83|nr:hypothetical protein [Halorussus halophilus]